MVGCTIGTETQDKNLIDLISSAIQLNLSS